MWYYIHHYFDPDFDHLHLKPVADSKGQVNLRNLNYVQNVVRGQILAEIRPLDPDTSPLPEKRFIMREPVMPAGANTHVDPENPNRLLATQNGFVFYYNKEITIKHLLNVRRNIDLHTGNIAFVGDIAVHGDVNSEFELRANNVLVKGIIEAAFIRTSGSIVGEGGFKGAQEGKLIADKDIRLAFAETGEIRAGKNIAIDGTCLHCNIFSGSNLLVRGRLAGGVTRARHKVYVAHQLGLASTTPTRVVLGQNPFVYRLIKKMEKEQERLQQKKDRLDTMRERQLQKTGEEPPLDKHYLLIQKKLEVLRRKLIDLHPHLYEENLYKDCILVVPGEILPGVIITIGDLSLKVQKPEQNVHVRRIGDEIVIRQPAVLQKYSLKDYM